ncbi:hypothetical protein JHK86_032336 [Glycine max]|nr:hypothetical protein JHK86_032336 [Glycine max]
MGNTVKHLHSLTTLSIEKKKKRNLNNKNTTRSNPSSSSSSQPPPQARSPRILLASWISLGIMVTRLA